MSRAASLAAGAALLLLPAPALGAPTTLLHEGWSDGTRITANDDWSGVAGVQGFLGDDPTTTQAGRDPRTRTEPNATLDVIANQSNPNGLSAGGVAEFDGLADPVVALQGSGTADFPHLVFTVDGRGWRDLRLTARLRDVDGSVDDALQPVVVQARTADGPYANLAFVGDATAPGATLVTPLDVPLPAGDRIDVRVLTTNAAGSDEWVGVDDVRVTAEPAGGDAPVLADCGAPLEVFEGEAGERAVSAGDADGTVTALALEGAPPGVTLDDAQPARGEGGTATAIVRVAPTVAPGTYAPLLRASSEDGDGTCAVRILVRDITPIHAVQGAGGVSPLVGRDVTIEGVVTGIDDEIGRSTAGQLFPEDAGVFVQQLGEDGDPATSEGVFVGFVRQRQGLTGKRVRITGRVREKFGFTMLEERVGLEPAVLGEAALPEPAVLAGTYEPFEGMRVRVPVAVANSGGTNKFGELFLTPGPLQDRALRTDPLPDGLFATDADAGAGDPDNPARPERPSTTLVRADLFDRVEDVVGPLAFSFANYKIMVQPDRMPAVVDGPTPFPFPGPAPAGRQDLRLASFNVENLFGVGGELDGARVSEEEFDAKVARVADAIGRLLGRPDVVAVQEVDTLASLQAVAERLGGYQARLEEGNDARGIDVGFLVRDTVRVAAVRQLGKGARGPAGIRCSDVAGGLFDRPPLAIDIESGPQLRFTALSNHFSSKAAPDACREAQAAFVRDEVARLEAAGREVLVTGDLNAFEDEGALDVLQDGTTSLRSLWTLEEPQERYSFAFQGLLQTLDHVLVTEGLAGRVDDFDYMHFDNDYFDRGDDGHKVSDHDPPLVTLRRNPGKGGAPMPPGRAAE